MGTIYCNFKIFIILKVENPTSNLKKEILPQENLNKRPPLMDFLDIRGSISGYKSFRDTEKGIFTSHFCYFLNFLLSKIF